jgi:hypothetical protein
MDEPGPAHVLVPVAVVTFAIAFFAVIGASLDGGSASRPAASAPASRSARAHRPRRFYVVRRGDILSSIAERTRVPVERLEELNPGLDPQTLRPGQHVKLRP